MIRALSHVPVAADRHHAELRVEAEGARRAGRDHHAAELGCRVAAPALLEQRATDPAALVARADHQLRQLLHHAEAHDTRVPDGPLSVLGDHVATLGLRCDELEQRPVPDPVAADLVVRELVPGIDHSLPHGAVVHRALGEVERDRQIGGRALAKGQLRAAYGHVAAVYEAAFRAAPSAGRISLSSRLRTRQGAPAKAWLATVAKPSSSVLRASRRWATLSAGGSSESFTPTQKQCTRLPPGATSRAPASPTSQTPSLPRSIARPVSRWSSRASCPRRSPSRPWATRSERRSSLRLDRTTPAPRKA